ncbi:dnaJ homolog subfamily C member 11 isoform X2 [Panthera pardus]|uniref:J domain-containing protein n=5 Tax=Felidae TaxID=9681 RepID=A0ABI8A2L6_FELCA|nr:dnaJ homolog subfamily C member 11 isoform X2 [Panthera pardus]XP_023113814.1 dnaJ homolog subfamily C member 11 isoform X1 [Felis catus]XP_025767906.1 dnaJ homolog subfamily C member 11 [Puma concolor]XP_030180366.1 dnaJ homolog subfamily C member 11 [Lynx canadensis]XP_040315926.1 dnaJ homolog subfamily C member 11 isoform X1 [Puma yagouaroundi]XP_042806029.1 dnaJ homolog subfamily C member 11 [Panthera leo]XP_042850754.1 dnaJ homolog subfamily C member 11 [Panthera tigris]XP_043429615.
MATALSEEELDNEDYYSLLNVRREASSEELKAAYRRLCMLYHPDKHRDPELKSQAERLFNLVHQAYEVLSDPQTRAIYDIYGKRGLEMEGWEVVERRRTPAEIREEFERLQREREDRRLQQRTNPKGTISVGIDATDLFDRYEEEYEDVSGSGFPQIEINKMHISQSIEAPLTATDTAILSGSLSTQNGNGGGSINFALRRVTSAKGWGELEFGAGDLQGPLFGLKLFRNLTPRCFVTTNCALQFSSRGIRPGLTTVLARNLDKNTVGYLQWRWGIQSAMNTSIVRDTKTSHFTVALQLGIPHSFALISYQHKFQDDDQTRVKGSLKAGFFGTVVEYGAERKISRHSVLGAAVSVGVPQGVSLKVKLNRASQTYFFPIHLTDQLLPSAVFYATVGPLVVYFALHRLVIKPYLRAQKEKELEKQRESTATDILQKKQEAEAAVRLMQESVRRIIEAEESRMGLIIVNAWYGKFVNDKSKKSEKVKVIDVTVPLQCLVKDSKLILTEASKAGLPGFYDPCVGEEKNLKVLYQFRGVLHQVMAPDGEALRIPKQSHRIDTDG